MRVTQVYQARKRLKSPIEMDMSPRSINGTENNVSLSNNEIESNFIPPDTSPKSTDEDSMTENEQRKRRASIKAIMKNKSLSELEKNKLIQGLMDGRTRTSIVSDYNIEGNPRESFQYCERNFPQENSEPDGTAQSPIEIFENSETAISSECSSSSSSRRQYKRSYSSFMSEYSDMEVDDDSFSRNTNPLENLCKECPHYERKCNIVSPCCGMIFGCRLCHDECDELPPRIDRLTCIDDACKSCNPSPLSKLSGVSIQEEPDNSVQTEKTLCTFISTQSQELHHNIDRFAISEIICKECNTKQSSKTNNCIKCHAQFGEYHCSTCNLWMSAEEKPYHCEDCGFCRIGGRENFRHCHDCGMCIAESIFDEHDCKEGRYKSACPVCQEDLFTSRSLSHGMQCGHAIHWHCFQELIKHDSRCPICKKTCDSFLSMMYTWESMAVSVAMQPVPAELSRLVTIQCNDCEEIEKDRWWHVIGTQCKCCLSFNTNIINVQATGHEARELMGGEEESLRREQIDAHDLVSATGKWLRDNIPPTINDDESQDCSS